MKYAHTLLTALLLTPLAVIAQGKPEVANATKAAQRVWESTSSATAGMRDRWLVAKTAASRG